jgi:hypothetical protein
MKFIENVVIGNINGAETNLFSLESHLFAIDNEDWYANESDKTYYTDERFLPKILVDLGIYPSISEIRRNRPDLIMTLDKQDFISKLKVAKKRFLWIAIGR